MIVSHTYKNTSIFSFKKWHLTIYSIVKNEYTRDVFCLVRKT